jgi:hypothetical protein
MPSKLERVSVRVATDYLRRNGWAMNAAKAPEARMRYPETLRRS